MVSQWGIGHKGKGAVFFKNLADGKKQILTINKFSTGLKQLTS
jgi:hypothetical protein